MSKVYDIVASRILAAIESGTVPWRQPWIGGRPANLVSGKAYTGINTLLLGCSSYDSRWWLTFKQAKALGGSVRKGEKASPIVFYAPLPPKINGDGEVEGSSMGRAVLRYYSGFNLEQCEGIEAPEAATLAERPDLPPIEALEVTIERMPKRPEIHIGSERATYSPISDLVKVPTRLRFDSREAYYSTLLHELAHATGHRSRLNRLKPCGGSRCYAEEELVAEVASCMVLAEHGIESETGQTAAYCAGWASRIRGMSSTQAVCRSLTAAVKAADWILGRSAAAAAAEAETDEPVEAAA